MSQMLLLISIHLLFKIHENIATENNTKIPWTEQRNPKRRKINTHKHKRSNR